MVKDAMTPKPALIGSGHFQWSGPGWAGTVLGSSVFLLPITFCLIYNGQATLAMLPMAAFFVLVMTGIALWRLRQSVYPFSAVMYFLAIIAVLIPTVWWCVGEFAGEDALTAMNWPNSVIANLFVSLLAPLLALMFWFIERRSKTKPQQKIAG